MKEISKQATEITDNMDHYNWVGSEQEGRICYFEADGSEPDLMKVLVYPQLSEDGYYEEYYYWEDQLFFAYIWEDHNCLPE